MARPQSVNILTARRAKIKVHIEAFWDLLSVTAVLALYDLQSAK